ncbi:26S proteasome non-ATPase regulatory subunit 3A [Abeliophyllum distichum]|uniref:Probable 26S proteasome non-ATPase regulatory subunit 3 n=1 Tax=Abeliophyllum distichum TaxID=126358 RepID=A0ABD1P9E9_9LAMI
MTPDLGQGGCSAIEDGVVLARVLAEGMKENSKTVKQENAEEIEYQRIKAALGKFAKERRWRGFDLISTAYMDFFKNIFIESQIFTKMTQDVEMKEQSVPSNSVSTTAPSAFQQLKEIAALIEIGAYSREVRRIVRAIRSTIQLRRKLKASVISAFLNFVLVPGSEAHSRLSSYLPKEDVHDMEVDTASSTTQVPVKHSLPELEIYCYLLVLKFLVDQKRYNEAKACSSAGIARVKNLNRRTVDVIASRLYFYYSLSYELTGDLAEIRGNLLALHRIATLRHDELGQETLLNLLLRNYLHYNLYDQAEKLRSKAPRFEAHSNQQFCRYLFYLGKIRTIQLEYTDAKDSLLQAARKAPTSALGFRVQCNKWAVIVRLLLGEIPERTVFMQKGMEKALRPYFELTNAVRIGDLKLFKTVAERFASTFSADRTNNLIVRLRHNVIRTGLRNISISYSQISLADVAKKLKLDSANPVADAESIVAKAIRDGAIDATLDHANGRMISKETGDIYSTNEPQIAFNSRIAFCLNMHNEAVRALRFPPNSHKEKESAEKRRERQQQEQELAKHIAEEDDDEF